MATYCATVHSTWRPDDTFDYVATFSNAAEWDPGVARGEALQAGPPQVGSVYRLAIPMGGLTTTFDYRVLEMERPRRVVLRAEHSLAHSTDTITVEPAPDGAVVHYEAVLEPKGLLRPFAPFVTRRFRAIGDRAVAGLRSMLG
jgi:Polyketide cyclase / dehydrase and lipid transport